MPRRRKVLSTAPSVEGPTGYSISHQQHQEQHRPISSSTKEKPHQRNAANARERARMRVLSRAFCRLKTTLPWVPADTKLSKLDTLRLATTYIGHLRSVLIEGSSSISTGSISPPPSHPLTLSWPFMFNKSATSGPATSPLSRSESPMSSGSSDHYSFQQDYRTGGVDRLQHHEEDRKDHQNTSSNAMNRGQRVMALDSIEAQFQQQQPNQHDQEMMYSQVDLEYHPHHHHHDHLMELQ